VAGGASVAEMEVVPEGANGSPSKLQVRGEIRPGFAFGFAGVAFNPGTKLYAPANLQGKRISFCARGDGKSYGLMVLARSYGSQPVTVPFVTPAEWKHYSIPLSDFDDMEGHDVTSIMFAGGPRLGSFQFELDEVRID
jgi:complex I intermediate-associated protein 30 (CIA30)